MKLLACTALLVGAGACALPAAAQTGALDAVYACSDIGEPGRRLACFDAKVAEVRGRESRREIVTIDSGAVEALERESFGLPAPQLPTLRSPEAAPASAGSDVEAEVEAVFREPGPLDLMLDDDPDTVEMAIARVTRSGKRLVFEMENGQVWRQSGGRVNYVPDGDIVARITPAAMGSFKMSLSDGKRRVRGLRVRRVK